jgi:lipopolysaccharide transport system ATP-binding protein
VIIPMTKDYIIRVEGLSKSYPLIHQRKGARGYQKFSDVMVETALKPFQIVRNWASGKTPEDSDTREQFWALKNVSFDIKQGEVVGIIGRNGAGKSTILKILSRITEPTKGRVRIRGRVASLLEVGTGFHGELTGRENIFLNGCILGMTRREIKRNFDEIVAFAEVEKFLDTPVKRYSSGMYVRLAFAVAAHLDPEILIVDEVLAVGDGQFQKKCLGKMQDVSRKEGRTVLFVSHNLGTVLNLCQRCIVMQNGQVVCNKPVEEAVQFYQHSLFQTSEEAGIRPPHVLFQAPANSGQGDMAITKIELLDEKGQPKPIVGTWDDVTFRIWYRSNRKVTRAAVDLQINTSNNVSALHLSTEPDGTLQMDILPGEHAVDCVIESLPLAAGEYIIGVGLTVPNVEWLWQQTEIATFTVSPRDVFGSGRAPVASRALVAPHHQWRLSKTA